MARSRKNPPKTVNGRPPHKPDKHSRHLVMVMKVNGEPDDVIARCIGNDGISLPTLYKHYRDELDNGKHKIIAAVAGRAFQRAMAGENEMIKLILRTRAGWSEKTALELSGKDGKPIEVAGTISAALVLDQRLEKLAQAMKVADPQPAAPAEEKPDEEKEEEAPDA